MKHFMDIERLKRNENDFCRTNCGAFHPGDIISIQEKIDGSCASIEYIDGKLIAYSRKQELNSNNTLAGFWNYVQELDAKKWSHYGDSVIFGEWCRQNKIHYNKDWYGKWIVYDIWDKYNEMWLPQSYVKRACEDLGLEYIHVLYEGEFKSWEHCMSFCHSPAYGDTQEGIVVKNQSRLNDDSIRQPKVLKIVNEEFSEIMKNRGPKEVDPAKIAAAKLVQTIVTERRVEKILFKLRDEGEIPEEIEPKDMKILAQKLPRRVYEDCVKEENETVVAMGEYSGKMISSRAMQIARELVLGV